jgi:uncharacterized protein (TIGR00369 family)
MIPPPVMSADDLRAFLVRHFPQASGFGVDRVTPEGMVLRLRVTDADLRAGGTVSGPAMFGLADVAVYLAIISRIGEVPLAVTTNAAIDFLRKPEAGVDLLGEARLLKLGRRLAVGDVMLFSEGRADPVARAGLTYSIPPR